MPSIPPPRDEHIAIASQQNSQRPEAPIFSPDRNPLQADDTADETTGSEYPLAEPVFDEEQIIDDTAAEPETEPEPADELPPWMMPPNAPAWPGSQEDPPAQDGQAEPQPQLPTWANPPEPPAPEPVNSPPTPALPTFNFDRARFSEDRGGFFDRDDGGRTIIASTFPEGSYLFREDGRYLWNYGVYPAIRYHLEDGSVVVEIIFF